jgi:hypothetical protein
MQPFEVPFKNHDELIEDEKELLDVAKNYKRRSADETSYLDIQRTISATIASSIGNLHATVGCALPDERVPPERDCL